MGLPKAAFPLAPLSTIAPENFSAADTTAACRTTTPLRTARRTHFAKQRIYRDKIMVTTLAPCWYCSGLIRQFGIGTVIVGESVNFRGGIDWLQENGIKVVDLASHQCVQMLAKFIAANPALWHEDIGQE